MLGFNSSLHQHFWFDDGNQASLLTKYGTTRQGMPVGFHSGATRDAVADSDDGAVSDGAQMLCLNAQNIPVILEDSGVLAAFTHPSHLEQLSSGSDWRSRFV